MKITWIIMAALVLVVISIAVAVTLPFVSASRLDAHNRHIDIDICIRCTQPQDTRQNIVTLHDDTGWNPGEGSDSFIIKAPFELEPGFSIEATSVNNIHLAQKSFFKDMTTISYRLGPRHGSHSF
jgi:hypothetical protein